MIFRQELEEVRQEILSLSEKYSYKCVETASLEEKLKLATHQAKQSQQMVQKLEQRFVFLYPKKISKLNFSLFSRNKQLRAHLISEDLNESILSYNDEVSTAPNSMNQVSFHFFLIVCFFFVDVFY